MAGGSTLVLALILAGIVEWGVERFCGSFEKLKGWPMIMISACSGVGLCFGFGVDILNLVGFEGGYPIWLGKILSGIIIGSGANAIHKFVNPSKK